jgi:hypothetical protein
MVSCNKGSFTANQDQITFSFPDEYKKYLPYEEIPNYTLPFEGLTFNTNDSASTSNKKVFGKNDDFLMSDVLSALFKSYEEKNRIDYRVLSEDFALITKMNRLITNDKGELVQETIELTVYQDKVYNKIAYISLENGLNLSIEYRHFKSLINDEVKDFYSWRYAAPLNMVLHYSFIVNQLKDGSKEFVLIPLPNKVIYHLGITEKLSVETVLKKEIYFDVFYRTFPYPDFSDNLLDEDNFDLETNQLKVINFYSDFNLKSENEEYTVSSSVILTKYIMIFLKINYCVI